MKKVKLYIATSLDGFIARQNGSLDWLEGIPNPNKIDYGYDDFYDSVDTVVMGRASYEAILGFDVPWPYTNCKSIIVSRSYASQITTPNTHLVKAGLKEYITQLKQEVGKDIWLVGGGNLLTSFLNEGLVDELMVCVAPVIIGEGVPLFPNVPKETKLKLLQTTPYETGMVMLTYQVIR